MSFEKEKEKKEGDCVTYLEHRLDLFNNIIPHPHDALSNGGSPRNRKGFPAAAHSMSVPEEILKCRVVDLVERLVAGDDPLGETFLEFCLVL